MSTDQLSDAVMVGTSILAAIGGEVNAVQITAQRDVAVGVELAHRKHESFCCDGRVWKSPLPKHMVYSSGLYYEFFSVGNKFST